MPSCAQRDPVVIDGKGEPAIAAAARPLTGLIVPLQAGEVPSDGAALYGDRVCFVARGLAITGVREVGEVSTETLVGLCETVVREQPGSDDILISCGGLLTLETIRIVESRIGMPVVSSSPAGFWDLMRVAGLDNRSAGNGRLFET